MIPNQIFELADEEELKIVIIPTLVQLKTNWEGRTKIKVRQV